MDGTGLFSLRALAWPGDQPSLEPRADHLFEVIAGAILTKQSGTDAKRVDARRDAKATRRTGH